MMAPWLLGPLCGFLWTLLVGYVMERRHQREIAKMQRAHEAKLRELAGANVVPIRGTYRSATKALPEVDRASDVRDPSVWTEADRKFGRPPPPHPGSRYADIKPIAYGPIPPIPAMEFPDVPPIPDIHGIVRDLIARLARMDAMESRTRPPVLKPTTYGPTVGSE